MAIPDMTFEKIVEKTKRILGKNYREQTEEVKEEVTEPETEGIEAMDLEDIEDIEDTENIEEPEAEPTDLEDICAMVIREAAQWTNRYKDVSINVDAMTEVMNDCWPVIVKCASMAYLNRGAEGLNSQSELGQQNVYNDWISLLHKQLTNRRYVV